MEVLDLERKALKNGTLKFSHLIVFLTVSLVLLP